MRQALLIFICLCFLSNSVFSQNYCQYPGLFVEKKSRIKRIIKPVYSTVEHRGKIKNLNIGIFTPKDNYPIKKRPLLIGVHGGGFIDFCPFIPCYLTYGGYLSKQYTQRGFTVASVEYRLNKRPRSACSVSDKDLIQAHYRAVQDVRNAIKFLVDNADKYNIDKNNIFLMGVSAGATTILHSAFLEENDLPLGTFKYFGRLAPRQKIKGVLGVSGALYDLQSIDRNDKTGIFLAHGKRDKIVPFGKGKYFGCQQFTPVYGSVEIERKAKSLGFKTDTYFFNGGHQYPKSIQNTTLQRSFKFLRNQIGCNKPI